MAIAITDRLVQRRLLTIECKDLPSALCAVANNSFGMLPACVLAWSVDEVRTAAVHFEAWTDPKVLTLLLLSGFVGLGICYSSLECQRIISATSFFVLQNVSKIAVVAMGVLVFHDPLGTP